MKHKTLIVEFSAWHDECLYTTCMLLKSSGHYVCLALNEDLRTRIGESFNTVCDEVRFYPFKKGARGGIAVLRLYYYLLKHAFTYFYLNSAQGSVPWKFFLLPIPKRIKIAGTLHNIKKLRKSIGQKFITHRINGYVLLSDLLVNHYNEYCRKPAVAVYPIFYPQYPVHHISKKETDIWITIPGAVSFERRDYRALFQQKSAYSPHIKFIILGNRNKADGKTVCEEILKRGMQNNFIFFDGYVPEDEFYSYIMQSDFIMPLVHPNRYGLGKYVNEKISGTYNLAIAYRKPMLCPREMEVYEDFGDSAIFYDVDKLPVFVNALKKNDTLYPFYKSKKWTKEEQLRRLIGFMQEL